MKTTQILWLPIATAPRTGEYILVLGDSGYTTTPYRVSVAKWSSDREQWVDHKNETFTYSGEEPFAWARYVVLDAELIQNIKKQNPKNIKTFQVKIRAWSCPDCKHENIIINEDLEQFQCDECSRIFESNLLVW